MRQESRGSTSVPVLAWGLCLLFVLLWVATAVLDATSGRPVDVAELTVGALAVGYPLVGALVAVREPRNAVGWLLLVTAIAFAISGVVDVYVLDLGRPFITEVAWFGIVVGDSWVFLAAIVLPLVFPNGRFLTPRWRRVLWIGAASVTCSVVDALFTSGPLVDDAVSTPNPWGATGSAATVVAAVGTISDVLFVGAAVLGILCLATRLRWSHGRERQQVKWFGYVTVLALGGLLLASVEGFTISVTGAAAEPEWASALGAFGWLCAALLMIIGIPVAVGVAILRHRLYDIDLVIKRTLVYGALTLALASVYLALVLGLRVLVDPVAGTSDLAVAASTLAVAALFRPVRSRIQQVVDRRFDRSRYDAGLAVQGFATRLRHEVDLDAVRHDLEGVVDETVHPAHVSLWLRGSA